MLLLALPALAGGRARYGGALKIAAVSRVALETDPLTADTPLEATVLQLAGTPPCRLGELSRPAPTTVHLALAPGVAPAAVIKAVTRARDAKRSPYAGLLWGLKAMTPAPHAVDFTLDEPAADLEHALCHPALLVPVGPFRAAGAELVANPQFPEGRPFVDSVSLSTADARTAERLLGQRRLHVALGAGAGDETALFATYLLAAPDRADLRQAVELTVDRGDLVRFFVRAPAAPLAGLLPPALGGPTAAPPKPARPTPTRPDVRLLYDASLDDQRAVAERLQVKLQPLGYRVALEGMPRKQLRERWSSGGYDLMLQGVLLPPAPAPALAVALTLGGHLDALTGALPSTVEPAARDKAARDAAASLLGASGLVPLYVQGLAVTTSGDLQHLTRDALGLPRLDDAFLAPE